MRKEKKLRKWGRGVTLIELVITMAIAVIPISSVTVLVIGGQHSWGKTYLSANRKIKSDAEASCTIFGRIGRMSDCENTALIESHRITNISISNSQGTGIEFRYWEQTQPQQSNSSSGSKDGRDDRDDKAGRTSGSSRISSRISNSSGNGWITIGGTSSALSSISVLPTQYARFYLEGSDLKIDYGPYPYESLRRRIDRTVVIAENVTDVEFYRTIENNAAQGCVKMEITLRDPDDGKVIMIKTATLLRN